MKTPLRPTDEPRRLDALRDYQVLDTPPEQALDDLTALAARICDAPISLISLVDEHRQWFKSKVGWTVSETAREVSFCGHVIAQPDLLIVPDAAEDERFADNPLVTGAPHIRFYAGAPLVTPRGEVLGTLCVIDCVPRQLTPSQQEALRVLSRQVIAQLELRRQTREHAESELRLRVSHERFQILARATNDALWDWDLATNALSWSDGYQALFGYLPAETDPGIDSWTRFIHPDDRDRVVRGIHGVIDRGGRTWSDEYRFQRRDGTYAEVFDRGQVIRDVQGGPLRMVGAMQDVTERRQGGAARRLAAIVESSEDAIVDQDLQSVITTWNSGAEELFGYNAAEMVGTSVLRLIPPGREDEERQVLEKVKRGARTKPFETLRTTKDGRLIDVAITASAIKDASGTVTGVSKVARDITERKRSEKARQASEARYRTLFECAPDGIVIANLESYYIDANPSMCRMLGYSRDEFIGLHASDIVTTEEIQHIGPALRAITAASDYHREWQFRRKDGSTVAAEVFASVMPDGNLLGMVRDVSERRLLEQQFQQAQKMEAIGRLAGGVAHDFNNLLTVILGYCELVLEDLDPADLRLADIAEIQRAGLRGAGLTRQLLAFSRKEIIEPMRLDLNLILADMRGMLGRLIGEDVKVVVRLRAEGAVVVADRGQVEQIVMNLAVNARDAMPGGGTLTVETASVHLDQEYARTHVEVTPGLYIALTVTDTGTGMPPDVQERLFEPFFTTKEPGKGTGLGLATVQGIMVRSDGSVSFNSEVGKGTSFTMYFPQAEEGEAAGPHPHAIAAAPVGAQTVLVVEDSDGLRELTRRLLERLGYTVLVAANSDEAFGVFEGNASIDVLLTDVVMPGGSGPELTKRLLERRPALKVIYMSGYTEDAIIHHGVLKPGIAFLHKPFTSETLGRKIRDVFER